MQRLPQGACAEIQAGRGYGALAMIRAIAITAVALVALGVAPAIAATRAKKPVKRARAAPRPPVAVAVPPVRMPPMPRVMPPAPPQALRPPLPPLANPPGEAAQPLASPGAWVTDADYPPEAKRLGEQGRVVVRMALDRKGIPYRCWVVSSSGSDRLDATTCYLMQTKARFAPARDPGGQPMEWTYQVAMRWTLADEPDPVATPPVPAPPVATRSKARPTAAHKPIARRRR